METSLEILALIEKINTIGRLIQAEIKCQSREFCQGNCCYSSNEIPKVLAEKYLALGLANPEDFLKSDILSYRIRLDSQKLRCIFFDTEINGCGIFLTNLRPPQCCIYPIRFNETSSKCKKGYIFKADVHLKHELEQLLNTFIDLSRNEAILETSESAIFKKFQLNRNRMRINSPPRYIYELHENVSEFYFKTKSSPNYMLTNFCNEIDCNISFDDCPQICEKMLDFLIPHLTKALIIYGNKFSFKNSYSLQTLLNLVETDQ